VPPRRPEPSIHHHIGSEDRDELRRANDFARRLQIGVETMEEIVELCAKVGDGLTG